MAVNSPMTLYKISLIIFACSFFLSYLLTPLIRRFSITFNIVDEPSLERKIHRNPMPLLGGMAIFLSFILTLSFLYLIISYHFSIGGPKYFLFSQQQLFWIKIGLYLISSMLILLIGILDDFKSIDFKLKLIVQSLAALILIFGGTRLNVLPWPFANILISFIWIVCLTNSLNLLDNMNGLTTGLSIIITSFFIIVAYLTQHFLLSIFLIIPLGALLGFLPYNFPKAKIFLGDTGSLFIGFSLATFSVWLFDHLIYSKNMFTAFAMLILLLSIPFFDTLTVIVIRIKNHRPIYVGDKNHLSHHLVRYGLSTTMAVIILYLSSIIFGTLGLSLFLL